MNKKGFSLIEVLVVSVIVAILAATAIPAYSGYKIRASTTICENMAAMTLKAVVAVAFEEPNIVPNIYTPESFHSSYPVFSVYYPPEYTVEIIVNGPKEIFVVVTDEDYMGTARLGGEI
jgi:prepilin-type N-terminal cleavage/methylation domain-containing protein